MVKFKKIGISVTTAALSLGLLTSVASAQTPVGGQAEKIQIQVASTETQVAKEDLIKKLKALFPNKFDFLTSNDFHMSTGHQFPGDDTIRYDLSFNKNIKGKYIHGGIVFAGDNLEIENFYYQPLNQSEALFPAKITEDEAKQIALDFIKKFPNSDQYKLNTNDSNYYHFYGNQLLTEPIRYSFSFARTHSDVKIADQQIHVSVLGNGDITEFYRNTTVQKSNTFDEKNQLKLQAEVLKKVKENLSLQLQYQINYDYRSDKRSVQLVYNPTTQFSGVHAISGNWYTAEGISESLPARKSVETIVSKQLPPKQPGITVEQAKTIANELLKLDSEDVKLTINHVEETKNYNGKDVIVINYSYEYKNGGYGSSIEIDKATGEIIQYHNLKNEVLNDMKKEDGKTSITKAEALTKATAFLKEWVPSYLHQYAKPINEPYYDKQQGIYSFSFPRVVNGIAVSGDEINVSITDKGELTNLYVNNQNIEEWPSTEGILSLTEATNRYKEAMNLELLYMKQNEEEKHYSLVYVPAYNEQQISSLDATTGEWNSLFGKKETSKVTHPTAEKELNYLIEKNILEVKDFSNFNANSSITKGEAIKILVKSLTYFYEGMYPAQEETPQTFENIGRDHPYYSVIERAVSIGIIDATSGTFDADAKMTREELAVWYIRALGLEQAAKHKDIYKVNVKDAADVTYPGHVALATALELLPIENELFSPKKEVTYADIAVSTIRLAHKVNESGRELHYY
ncbi:S-layer family protein [Ureibacillus xyleni]|uniref:S-layer family protein n=1 Tax=Ureibacillus xyleni TaxID=614648 RepID=A0A285S0P9_9BACL|nr:YcdB/YcdC domain-containing protein [Ureibacillus xyleni]SOB98619.1 S-layer family protein [Ureibacillus xyleni]